MRYMLGFLCVCALGVVPVVGCGDLVNLSTGSCAGVVCPDDGNDCTDERCRCDGGWCTAECVSAPVINGTNCDFDGLVGVCISGVCEEDLWCGGVVCEDGNDCTGDTCDYVEGACDYSPAQDGSACSGGFCLDGVCDILVDQCTADDLAAIEAGDEPDSEAIANCATAAIAIRLGNLLECRNQITECQLDAGTTLTTECSYCFASGACCVLNECSHWVGGPCTDEPQPGDACDMCIQEHCQPLRDVCVGGQ